MTRRSVREDLDSDARATARGRVRLREQAAVRPARPAAILQALSTPKSVVGEELLLLSARIQAFGQDRRLRCLALTSALPGDGKTTLAIGLAAALARTPDQRVLLVEADIRRPALADALGLPATTGLSDWLKGNLDEVPIRAIDGEGFCALFAGAPSPHRREMLGATPMEALLTTARDSFDYVVVDTAPVLPVADTVLLQDLVDGLVLVARSRRTPRAAILEALGRLRDDKVLGVVLNDHEEYQHSYKTYAYQQYGMHFDPKEEIPRTMRSRERSRR